MARYLVILLGFALAGCAAFPSHIHDPEAAAVSEKLQKDFALYSEAQSSLYQSMALNLEAFAVEEERLLADAAANFHTALVTKAPTLTWEELGSQIAKAQARQEALQDELLRAIKEDRELKRTIKPGDLAQTAAAIKSIKKEIKAEKARVAAWQDMTARFHQALADLPASLAGLSQKTEGLAAILGALEDIDPANIESIKTLKLDGDQLKDLKNLLGESRGRLRNAIKQELVDAPGIALRILELGLELAQLNKERAESRLLALKARQEVYEETLVYAQIAGLLLGEAASDVKRFKPARTAKTEKILATVLNQKPSKDSKHTVQVGNAIAGMVLPVRGYASAEWILTYQESVLPVRLARLAHKDSITQSAVNDRAWQAVISSGIDALAEYHKGGFSEEDAANLLRLAQAVALVFIAS